MPIYWFDGRELPLGDVLLHQPPYQENLTRQLAKRLMFRRIILDAERMHNRVAADLETWAIEASYFVDSVLEFFYLEAGWTFTDHPKSYDVTSQDIESGIRVFQRSPTLPQLVPQLLPQLGPNLARVVTS